MASLHVLPVDLHGKMVRIREKTQRNDLTLLFMQASQLS